tara:strand:+ start:925 stop:1164 length:240 start_codon:yes stop_codon:yes gene_type:complete
MKITDFKKGNLMLSGNCKTKEELEKKISERIYYNSKVHLTMFEENKGLKWFFLVDFKGEIKQQKIIKIDKKGNFQYRYF